MNRATGLRPIGLLVVAVLVVSGLLAGCTDDDGNDNATRQAAVRAASAAWDEAFNSGDLATLMTLYADDAVSMPYYGPALEGRTAIESDFDAFFEGFEARHETTIVDLKLAGEWAIERGRYTLAVSARDGSDAWEELGKHIVVRRETEDGWKVVWEIWNLDE